MDLLTEFGTDFPVSGGLKQVFDKCRAHKKVTNFVRTLFAVAYVYEDNTVLIVPLKVLQYSKACREISEFLLNRSTNLPTGVYYSTFASKILDFTAISGSTMRFICVLESLESHTIDFSDDLSTTVNFEKLNLTGEMVSAKISFPYIVAFMRNGEKYNVYASSIHNVNKIYSIQCTIDELAEVYVFPPTLYFRTSKGIFGCSFDETGQRQFPRQLSPVLEATDLVTIRTFNKFYLFNRETSEMLCIKGRKVKSTKMDEKVKMATKFFALGPYLFALLSDKIVALDFVTGAIKSEMSVPNTNEWIVSHEKSYGAVCIGEKSYSISRTSVPPLINLYASPSELKEELKKAKDATGTVATPIILMANRSPYLAATLMKDELQAELNIPPVPGSMQEFLRPSLVKINTLLQQRP